jgi:FkbM family methyltransferase
MHDTITPGSIAVDVGAYAGFYSLLLSRLVGEHGQVHAFEPVPENFQLLRHNVQANACANIRTNRGAVGSTDGRTVFRRSHGLFSVLGGFANEADPSRYEDVEVNVRSLDSYFADLGWPTLSFAKIDVEGAAADVVSGMQGLIERFSPSLLIEVHGQPDRGGGVEARQLLPIPFHYRYRVFMLEKGPDLQYPLPGPEGWIGHGHCVARRPP